MIATCLQITGQHVLLVSSSTFSFSTQSSFRFFLQLWDNGLGILVLEYLISRNISFWSRCTTFHTVNVSNLIKSMWVTWFIQKIVKCAKSDIKMIRNILFNVFHFEHIVILLKEKFSTDPYDLIKSIWLDKMTADKMKVAYANYNNWELERS